MGIGSLRSWACIILLAAAGAGCNGPIRGLYPPRPGDPSRVVYLTSNHWHTGFVLAMGDMPARYRRLLATFQDYPYVEIGWGNDLFYRARKETLWLGLRAAFSSPRSVLHVVGIRPDPSAYYAGYECELDQVRLSQAGYERLLELLAAAFVTDRAGRPSEVQNGLYDFSRFYRAHGWYCALHTCNHWTADGLRATGFPVTPAYAFTADNLMGQVRTCGRRYQADIVLQRQ